MTDRPTVIATLDRWLDQGWLTPLDRAFADFLLQQEPDASTELLWAGALVSRQFSRGEVCLDLAGLSRHPIRTLALADPQAFADAPARTIDQWITALSSSALVDGGEGSTPLVLADGKLYLRRFWRCKQIVRQQIQCRLTPVRDELPDGLVATIQALFTDNAETPDWQKIACVLSLRARFSIITGGPGTGKTTTLTRLLGLLVNLASDRGERPPEIVLAAPTGKAAARVSASITSAVTRLAIDDAVKARLPRQAFTLHRLLGSRPDSRRFRHNDAHRLVADIVIVDEASMIDLEMMAALLTALPDHAQLILLGDKDQLASVEAGAVMGELCDGAQWAAYDEASRSWIARYAGVELSATDIRGSAINQQTVMLRHSHRFGADSGIGKLAEAVNRGDAESACRLLSTGTLVTDQNDAVSGGEDGFVSGEPSPTDGADRLNQANASGDLAHIMPRQPGDPSLRALILRTAGPQTSYGDYRCVIEQQRPPAGVDLNPWALAVLDAFDGFRVLCAVRGGDWGVDNLNRLIERWLFPSAEGNWYEGRPVMVTRNDYDLNLMNGDIGITLRDGSGRLRVVFAGEDGLRWLSPMRLADVETAFAMTVHKSQGSEFDHVVFILPDVDNPVLTRELVYTAITRARRWFTMAAATPRLLVSAINVSARHA